MVTVPQPGNPAFATEGPFASDPQKGYMALFKRAYTDLVRLELQQTESILQDTCINEAMRGEVLSFDRYLKHAETDLAARTRGQTYGDQGNADAIQYKVTNTERRLVNPTFVDYAELFDPRDEYALMRAVRPDGQFLKNVSGMFNRKKDTVILNAIKAAVTVDGTKFGASTTTTNFACTNTAGAFAPVDAQQAGTGVGGTTTTLATTAEGQYLYDNVPAFKVLGTAADGFASSLSGNAFMLAHAYNGSTWKGESPLAVTTNVLPTKMGVNTLIQARKTLHAKNAIQPGDRVFCVLHPNQFYQLMEDADDTRLTSIDFNDGKPLVGGAPMNYMGFEFRVTTQVPEIASKATFEAGKLGSINLTAAAAAVVSIGNDAVNTGHEVYFYTDSAMVYGQAEEVTVRMDEIPERGYALQLYHSLGLGGLRLDGDKIVIKRCLD